MLRALIVLALSSTLLACGDAEAQEKPRHGGELIFLVPSEPPSYDGHREGTFGTVHPLAPLYNTLLRIDPTDRTGTRPVPGLRLPGGQLGEGKARCGQGPLQLGSEPSVHSGAG